MANSIKQVSNVNGSTMNLGDIELAAIRGVEQGDNVLSGNLTNTGILTHNNAEGKYVNGYNTVVKSVEFTASSANIDSGAIYVPANSLFIRGTVVVTEALAYASATLGVSFGTAAGGTQLTGTLDADSLATSATSLAVGKGNSTDEVLDTALEGATHIARTAGAGDFAAAGEIHGRVKASTGAFTDGTVSFIVEFIHLGGN